TGTQYNAHASNQSPERPRPEDSQARALPFERIHARRRQTLLCLLNALNELNQAESRAQDASHTSSFEDERDAPTLDEQIQIAGAETFSKFQKSV
ncbi:hypothetical protein ID866_2095, partial [Astraeus odoratus]